MNKGTSGVAPLCPHMQITRAPPSSTHALQSQQRAPSLIPFMPGGRRDPPFFPNLGSWHRPPRARGVISASVYIRTEPDEEIIPDTITDLRSRSQVGRYGTRKTLLGTEDVGMGRRKRRKEKAVAARNVEQSSSILSCALYTRVEEGEEKVVPSLLAPLIEEWVAGMSVTRVCVCVSPSKYESAKRNVCRLGISIDGVIRQMGEERGGFFQSRSLYRLGHQMYRSK